MRMNWERFGIDISKCTGGKGFCPRCHADRKHKRDRSLSVDTETGLFNCHNCGFSGIAIDRQPKKEYAKPVPRLEKLSKKSLQFFENTRGISNDTLLRMKITEGVEWMTDFEKEVQVICFNYFRDEQLVNIKFRGPKKSFKMSGGAELVFYNLDSLKGEKECVVVEGEIDALTLVECGIYNVVSVPNGASKGNTKLEYLDNCWQEFESIEKIILAVDGDESGKSLAEELSRRLGRERCYQIIYPEGCKDSNEVLLKHNKQAVKDLIDNSTAWPIPGIKTAFDMYDQITEWYVSGYPKGANSNIPGFDLQFIGGQVTTVTGIPSHGKDEWMNYLAASLTKNENWIWGICGFEESPEESATKIIEKLVGKSFSPLAPKEYRMTIEEYNLGIGWIDKYFFMINPDEIETSIDNILDTCQLMVKRYGCKGFIFNPWNWFEHNREVHVSETEYVSLTYTKFIKFARKNDVHIFVIAHTTKMLKEKNGKYQIPTLYNVSGSANFYNKTSNGICVYRDFESNLVDIYRQKVKQHWLGNVGFSTYQFNIKTRQYEIVDRNGGLPPLPEGTWKPYKEDES